MQFAVRTLAPAAALVLLLFPLAAQAQRPCITDEEIERVLGPQVRSGALLIDASKIDNGRPLCTGGTIARRIHRMREDSHPDERDTRLAREEMVRADVARLARESEEALDRRAEAERLEELARIAEARRDAAIAEREAAEANAGTTEARLRDARARADLSEAELRDARARSRLAALPPVALPPRDAAMVAGELDALLQADASFWMFRNDYRPRSLRNVRMAPVDASQRNAWVTADFSYRSGGTGHIEVMYLNGQVDCLRITREFTCRKPGNPESIQIALGLFNTLTTFGPLFFRK
jgi:hypothetical protein